MNEKQSPRSGEKFPKETEIIEKEIFEKIYKTFPVITLDDVDDIISETIKLCNEAQGIDNFINSLPGKTEEELKGAIMRISRELELRREHEL